MERSELAVLLDGDELPPGWQLSFEPTVDSTMDLARAAARRGRAGRSLFLCDHQLKGRGRRGRRWEAPPGTSLLFTVLLRDAAPPVEQTRLVTVSLAEAIEAQTGLKPAVKWPNDLLLDDAKLAGVLTESYSAPTGSYVLVGCGLNVNQERAELADLSRAATSLRLAGGQGVHRPALLRTILERIDTWLGLPAIDREPAVRRAWEQRLWRRGRRVRLLDGGQRFEAVLTGTDLDGALLVRLDDGTIRRVLTGELLI